MTVKDKPSPQHHSESHQDHPGWDEHHFTLPLAQTHSIKLPSPPQPATVAPVPAPVAPIKHALEEQKETDHPTLRLHNPFEDDHHALPLHTPIEDVKASPIPVSVGAPVKPEQPVI